MKCSQVLRLLPLLVLWIGAAEGAGLSVREVVETTLNNNADIEAAAWRIKQARRDLAASRAAFRPQLGLELGYLSGDAPSAYLFKKVDSRELPPGTNLNQPGGFDNVDAGVGIRYTLWDGGRRRLARTQAKIGIRARTQAREAVRNDLIHAAIHGYFDLLAARESIEAATESHQTVTAQLREARVRERGGSVLRADVLSLEVRLAEAEERRILAANAADLAQAALARLMDRDADAVLALSGEEWEPDGLPATFSAGLRMAYALRPELAALAEGVAASRKAVAARRAETRPRVDLHGRYWMADNGGDLEMGRDNWTIGAALNWDLVDGGRRRAFRAKARAGVEEAEARRRSLRRDIELAVRSAYLDLSASRARAEVAAANVTRAQEGHRLVQSQFEGGAVTVTRYLQAEEDRTGSRLREIRSRYDLKKAKATVGHALGLCVKNAPVEAGGVK